MTPEGAAKPAPASGAELYLVDGTYELFRHHFGQKGRTSAGPLAGVAGVVTSVLSLFSSGVTHLGVATDHVIESFRNDLWPTYKDSSGMPAEITSQFEPLEEVLQTLGVCLWPMVVLEADDALASVASFGLVRPEVARVVICTPDKDLAQCVRGEEVVQLDRRNGTLFDEAAVVDKFGVEPESIPDWLALVGDSADGFPGLPGWGKVSAAVVLAHYRHLDKIPKVGRDWAQSVRDKVRGADNLAATLAANSDLARLFLDLATLRVDETLVRDPEELRWRGPAAGLGDWPSRLGLPDLERRVASLAR